MFLDDGGIASLIAEFLQLLFLMRQLAQVLME